MATRNILHINKLTEFEQFLEDKGYMILATSKNPFEVLRAKKDSDTVIVYQKKDAKEHLSTMDKDYRLVREFIKSQRKQSNAHKIRQMSDGQLAEFLTNVIITGQDDSFRTSGILVYINEISDWLQKPAE